MPLRADMRWEQGEEPGKRRILTWLHPKLNPLMVYTIVHLSACFLLLFCLAQNGVSVNSLCLQLTLCTL